MTARSETDARSALARRPIDWKHLGLIFLSRYGTIFGLALMMYSALNSG